MRKAWFSHNIEGNIMRVQVNFVKENEKKCFKAKVGKTPTAGKSSSDAIILHLYLSY